MDPTIPTVAPTDGPENLPPLPPASPIEAAVREGLRKAAAIAVGRPTFRAAFTPDELDRIRLDRDRRFREVEKAFGDPAELLWKLRKLSPKELVGVVLEQMAPTEMGRAMLPPPELAAILRKRFAELKVALRAGRESAARRYRDEVTACAKEYEAIKDIQRETQALESRAAVIRDAVDADAKQYAAEQRTIDSITAERARTGQRLRALATEINNDPYENLRNHWLQWAQGLAEARNPHLRAHGTRIRDHIVATGVLPPIHEVYYDIYPMLRGKPEGATFVNYLKTQYEQLPVLKAKYDSLFREMHELNDLNMQRHEVIVAAQKRQSEVKTRSVGRASELTAATAKLDQLRAGETSRLTSYETRRQGLLALRELVDYCSKALEDAERRPERILGAWWFERKEFDAIEFPK